MEYHDTNTLDVESPVAGIAARIAASFAINPNTRRAYGAGWARWQAWALHHGTPSVPAHPQAVSAYLNERAKAGLSPATVHVDRASIAAAHRAAGAGDLRSTMR